jgi:hypothetical protein
MYRRPGIRVLCEGIGAVLEKHAQGFQFAGCGSVVERVIAFVVVRCKDGGGVEEKGGDKVEGSCAGFTSEHELLVVLDSMCSSRKERKGRERKEGKRKKETYGIQPIFVLPCYTLGEPLRKYNAHILLSRHGRKHKRRL